jgi:hypothetical protein
LEVDLRRLTLVTGLCFIITFFIVPAKTTHRTLAQTHIQIINPSVEHTFGQRITFRAEIASSANISQVQLVFTPEGNNNSIVVPVDISFNNRLQAQYQLKPQDNILPFSTITYQYMVSFNSGEQAVSDIFSFQYSDNRHRWKTLEEANLFKVHWYEGDLTFGQAIYDAAVNTLDRFKKYLILPNPENMDIYVYASPGEIQEILDLADQPWVAGHAAPNNNLVLVSITPGALQLIEIERQIPHEITHLRLYRYLGDGYDNLPTWLDEGIASLAEAFPNSDYKFILTGGYDNDTLLSYASLCESFPPTTSDINLAYAQSDSFTRFIYREYGSNGLQNLLDAYKQGHSCEKGPSEAFGINLTQLERLWYQDTFGEDQPFMANELLIWSLFCLIVLVTPITAIILTARRK